MAKGFKFGKDKKSTKPSHSEKLTSDISEYSIIEKEQTIKELQSQIETLESSFNEQLQTSQEEKSKLSYALELKEQDIEMLKQTLIKRNNEVQDLSTKIHELDKQLDSQKPIDDRVTKKPLKNDVVSNMREFALSILDSEGDFFKKIAEKFKISKSTAYRYCQDIHKSKKVKE